MIQKLRRSFVRVTMLAAALVLVVLMGVVNVSNYIQRSAADQELLDILAENDGRFPGDGKRAGGKGGRPRFITEETPYETRYFSVLLDGGGVSLYEDTTQIAAVTPMEAAAIAQTLAAEGRSSGFYQDYRFTAVTYDGGYTLFIFLDCGRNLSAVRVFLLDSVVVTVIGLAVLFGLAWLLSDRAVRPIAESYEKQKTFITNAGHELKTPLAVIGSATDVIEIESGESQWTRSIHSQVERLTALTQQLIALARMDEGTSRLVLEELDLSALVRESLDSFGPLAAHAGHSLVLDLEPNLTAGTNRDAVEKICAILADNAVKYAAPESELHFTLRREGGHILLRAENPAEGLSPGKQEQLFDRFYRGDASRGDKPGYGLGLPLARSLAEALGGGASAASPDGQRLVVTVRLN